MDENTVRLWLKDHQDAVEKLARQQAKAFQLQIDTLRAELQATVSLLQNRQGGGGDQGLLLPRSMRLDVPKLSGDDPKRWIFAITEYFLLFNTPVDQHLRIVGFNLEGLATEWFWWMSRNGLITTWDRFVESVKNRFGPSKYEDPQGALSKLLQLGTVKGYQREFERLMNRVRDIPNSLLTSFYIFGLKLHLQQELLVSKPTAVCDVFSLARTTEARMDDQATLVAGVSAGSKANKVVNDGVGEVKVLNWVQQAINVESTSDNDARDQASELETKVLVDGKQDEAKVVGVANEQNSDEPNVLEGNEIMDVGVNENNKGVDKEVQYPVYTLHVFIPLLKRLNDKHIKKKNIETAIQRRLWDSGIKIIFLYITLRTRWFLKVWRVLRQCCRRMDDPNDPRGRSSVSPHNPPGSALFLTSYFIAHEAMLLNNSCLAVLKLFAVHISASWVMSRVPDVH
ncbi:retrotransposon-related protein [Tanacetum coccineum]